MSKRIIVVDSSANLSTLNNIVSVPLSINLGEKSFIDDKDVNVEEFLTECENYKGKSSSSCPSVGAWLDAFQDADEIFAIALTSGLSGAYNSLTIAKNTYLEENPSKKIFAVDSLSTGAELPLMVEFFQEGIEREKTFEQICLEFEEYKKRLELNFMLKSLSTFAKNGRVSLAVSTLVGLLNICIVGRASDEGTLQPLHKVHGEKKAILAIFNNMKESGYNGAKVRITHTFNEKGAETLKSHILSEFPNADVTIGVNKALCAYYTERGGILVGFEKN